MTPELTTPAVIAEIIDELTEPKAKVTYTDNLAVYNQDERHKRLLLDNKDRIISYIRSLEADHREMKRALKDVSVMQAEDNFKSWKDKVNDVQTWQEQFFNEVILKPVNEYAKEVLSSLHLK